jgi:multidrug resistance efflux pump
VDAYPGAELTGSVSMVQAGTAGEFSEFVPADTTGDYVKVAQLIAVRIALDDTRNLDLVPGMNVEVTMRRG